jgi:two-component system, LytTR family, response regulator
MQTIKVVMADDEILAREVIKEYLKKHPLLELVAEGVNGIEAVNLVNEFTPDVLFLDIQMPDLNGFDALKEIDITALPLVVFTTAYDKYALKAFDASAIDYLLKPFDQERFDVAIEKVKKYASGFDKNSKEEERQKILINYDKVISAEGIKARYAERILVKENKKLIPVRLDDIQVFEADRDYVKLHITGNTRKRLISKSLSYLETILNPAQFIRIHKSIIIKIDDISEMKPHTNGEYKITMKNGMEVKLSRSYKEALHKIGR